MERARKNTGPKVRPDPFPLPRGEGESPPVLWRNGASVFPPHQQSEDSWAGVLLGRPISSEPVSEEGSQQDKPYHPPKPMQPVRHRAPGSEFAFDEVVIIKLLFRQVETIAMSVLGPACSIIRTAFGAGFRLGRHVRAAIGANPWRHGETQGARCEARDGMGASSCGERFEGSGD